MAKKNKLPPPSSPTATKRRRITPSNPAKTSTTSTTTATTIPSSSSEPSPLPISTRPAARASNTGANASPSSLPPALANAPKIHIVPGSKIRLKVRGVLSALGAGSDASPASTSAAPDAGAQVEAEAEAEGGAKAVAEAPTAGTDVVLLEARAPAANKLVSVVEIAKRQLESAGRKGWWAYAGVRGELEERERERAASKRGESRDGKGGAEAGEANQTHAEQGEERQGREGEGAEQDNNDNDEDEAFEPLKGRGELPGKKVRNVPVLTVYLATRPVPELRALYGEQRSEV